jgi:hypothetical protein
MPELSFGGIVSRFAPCSKAKRNNYASISVNCPDGRAARLGVATRQSRHNSSDRLNNSRPVSEPSLFRSIIV